MNRNLKIVRPKLYDEALLFQRIHTAFENGCLTNNGPFMRQFEEEVVQYLGIPSLALANGTLGIELVLRSLHLQGEVIVPSFTYWATAHAICFAGLKPVFVDIDPETFTLDPIKVKEAITPKTCAILAVHVFGNPCAIDDLAGIAKAHNLPLIFDAAHAFGAIYKGRRIGQFGAAEIFSTHATKTLNSVEGGIVSTANATIFSYVQRARNFGMVSSEETDIIGTNAKMSELHALVGLDSLAHLREALSRKNEIVSSYQKQLQDIPGLQFQKIQPGGESSYFFFSIVINKEKFGMNRDDLATVLDKEGIQARKYFYRPLHQHQSYQHYGHFSLPHTEAIASNILCLPTHADLALDDVDAICAVIRTAAKERNPSSPAISSFHNDNHLSNYSITNSSVINYSGLPSSASHSSVINTSVLNSSGIPPSIIPAISSRSSPQSKSLHQGKRVLVTGGGGYVGCVVVKKLLEKGYQVRVLDQLVFGKEPLSEFAHHPGFDLEVGLVEDRYMVEKCLKGVQAIIHLSGMSNDPTCEINQDLTRKANVEATQILLDRAKAQGVGRFIYASSCSVYGFTEGAAVHEGSPINPLTAYAKSKVDCEKIIIPEARDNFIVVCLRKATIYGPSPRMRFDLVINTMTGTAMSENRITINGGEQWRPFLHVEDAADAYIFMLEAEPARINGQIFNVGSNEQNIKIADLADHIAKLVPTANVEKSLSPDHRSYLVSFDKINALGWKAARSIEEGILGVAEMFKDGRVKEFRDLNYFNIRRMITYLNV